MMKIINFIVGLSIAFSCASMAESKNELPNWLNVSKQDYNTVRSFFLSGFAAKAMSGDINPESPDTIINDFNSNELAAEKKWSGVKNIYGEIRGVKSQGGEPIVELFSTEDKTAPFNFIKLKFLDNKKESLLTLRKGQWIYATCVGVEYSLTPIFNNCSPSVEILDAALSYSGEYLFPSFEKFKPTKLRMKNIISSNDELGMANFAGYVIIADISKDPDLMKKIKECTPWKPECMPLVIETLKHTPNIMSKYEQEGRAFFEEVLKS
ncbi:TPA: hypothetical protein ACIO2X_004251 [Salmonella enterica subsp. salamae serovar 21:z10:z6]